MIRFLSLMLGIFIMLAISTTGFAQTAGELKEIKRDIEVIKESQKATQKDIQEIKKLLQPKQAPAEFKEAIINIKGDPFKGDKNAKIALIEISDYQCPFCARHVRESFPQIDKDYIQTGKIRYVFKDLPLEAIHPQAFKAAEAAHCAGDQGKFWQMHDTLFANMKALSRDDLLKYAKTEGLDMPKFQQCLDSSKYAAEIRGDMAEAQKAGITGTPAFLLGFIEQDGKVKAVRKISGAQPYAAFKDAIEAVLSQQK